MAQIVIDIDNEMLARIDRVSRARGKSRNEWIAERIKPAQVWPDWLLAGEVWSDFPTLEEIRSGYGPDTPRQTF